MSSEPSYRAEVVPGKTLLVTILAEKCVDETAKDLSVETLLALLDQHSCTNIVVYLGNTNILSSAPLSKFVHLHKCMKQRQRKLILCSLTKHVTEVINTANLNTVLSIQPSIPDALAVLIDNKS